MKSNKKYVFSLLAVEMIILPVLYTIVASPVTSLMDRLFSNVPAAARPGRDSLNFIYLLVAFAGALLLGAAAGLVYSRFKKNKPDSARIRYLTALVPAAYALVFAVLAAVMSKGNFNSGWWGIYTLKNPFFAVFDIAAALYGRPHIIPAAEIALYLSFAGAVMLPRHASKRHLAAFLILCTSFAIFTAAFTGGVISNGIIELRYGKSTIGNDLTEFDLYEKAPFNNGLVKLPGNASLIFSEFEEMPRLDGATAAYPVYAAFVEAVYKGLGDYYTANLDKHDKDIEAAFVSSDSFPFNIVKCSKTPDAYLNLINGRTDIIFVAEPSKAQVEMIKAKGDDFVLTPIGSEAFVFFTNRQNPVDNLTTRQLQDIYAGKISNWREVGGPSAKILAYQRPEDSGSQTIMQNKVMNGVKMLPPTTETYAGGMGEIISNVASYKNARNALGYSFMYYSTAMIRNNQIKYISINGIRPSPQTVRSREYPFTVPVFAVTLKSNTNKNTARFLDWILSSEGQSLISKTGYVPVRE